MHLTTLTFNVIIGDLIFYYIDQFLHQPGIIPIKSVSIQALLTSGDRMERYFCPDSLSYI